MIKSKEIALKERIIIILDQIIVSSRNTEGIKNAILKEFKSRNLSTLQASYLLSGNLDLNSLSDSYEDIRFLFLFTWSLSKALLQYDEDVYIDVKDYFTEVEIKRWEAYKEEKKVDEIFPITFENAVELKNNIWEIILTAQQLHELRVGNVLLYNFKTQRNPKITATGGIKINMDTNKIQEIKERLLNDEQYPDPIILNVLNNGMSKMRYSENTKDVTIFEGSAINIVDGFHRIVANSLAIEENPDLNFKWQITLTFLTEDAAHDFMQQKNKQKPMKKEYVEISDFSKPENLIVNMIADDRVSLLAKVMRDDDKFIRINRALTKKKIISTAIRENYQDLSDIKIRKIANWIVEFTDYLFILYEDEFINKPYEVKDYSMINDKNIFYGYIALSAVLKDNPNWKEILKQKMSDIDFNKGNKLWREIGMLTAYDLNKTRRRKLYNLFKEGIECTRDLIPIQR